MGCWNGTCAISNLPIKANTPVKLIFLKGEYNYSGISAFYEPTTFMSPVFYPIDAIYDNYGSVENIVENWNTDIINNYLFNRFGAEIPHHLNSENDITTVKTHIETIANLIERSLPFNDIFNQIKEIETLPPPPDEKDIENYLKWSDMYFEYKERQRNNSPLSFILIRKDIWDRVIKMMSEFKDSFYSHYDKNWIIPKTYKDYLLEEFKHKIQSSINSYNRWIELSKSNEKLLRDAVYMSLRASPFKTEISTRENLLTYKDYHNLYLETNDELLKTDILNAWMETELIHAFMIRTRRAWSVHPGSGSQCTNYELYAELGKAISDIAEENLNEQDND